VAIEVLSLQSETCLDPARVGGKAARLAAALRCRLPVLPGMVIPVGADAGRLIAAAGTVEARGVHAARLDVMDSTAPSLAGFEFEVQALGNDLVVRSSSPLEDAPEYAGAFTSYVGVTPAELATAVRGVWASALVDPALAVDSAGGYAAPAMAVLVQPRVHPSFSGTAQLGGDEVTVVAVAGSPGPLLAGWSRGDAAIVDDAGAARGPAVAILGAGLLAEVAALSRRVHGEVGDDLIEWAATAAGVVLLQARHAAPRPAAATGPSQGGVPGAAAGVARLVHAFAGPLGEELMLPLGLPGVHAATLPPPLPTPARVARATAGAAWVAARALSHALRARAWGADDHGGRGAAAVIAQLRGGDIAAVVGRLAAAPPIPAGDVAALLLQLGTVAAWMLQTAVVSSAHDLWAMTADDVDRLLAAPEPDPDRAPWEDARRRALLRWEPLIYTAMAATGAALQGDPVSGGWGAGMAVLVRGLPTEAEHRPRMVVIAPHPIPQLAPLLWGAAGLVTAGGSGAAHLVEVARSRGVPAVVGCDHNLLFALVGDGTPRLVAVDGDGGRVTVDAGGA
jgi:phosphohistidine swiveling domain-containing protein